jgi:hypothetical protein
MCKMYLFMSICNKIDNKRKFNGINFSGYFKT